MITSYYLRDDVVVCHALPNLVQCMYIGESESVLFVMKSFFFSLLVTVLLQCTSFTGDNHSQSSSFNKEIEKWVARSYFGNSSFVKALLKMALSSFMALFIFKCGLCINYAKRLVKILAPLFHPT